MIDIPELTKRRLTIIVEASSFLAILKFSETPKFCQKISSGYGAFDIDIGLFKILNWQRGL